MAQKKIIFRMNFGVEECLWRLREAADEGQWTPFSLSGCKGSKDLLARIEGSEIRVWKRNHYRNDFRRYFFGKIIPQGNVVRIEGYFAMPPFMKFFMSLFLGFAALAIVAGVIASRQDIEGSRQNWLIF